MNKSILISESYKKGFILSSSINVAAKIVGFFNVAIIAYFFGTTSATDVYFFCMSFLGMVSTFLIALNGAVLIPEAMRIKEQHSKRESQHFLSFFLLLYIAVCVICSVIMLANPLGIFSLVSKIDSKNLGDNINIIYLSIPLLALTTINAFFTDILVSYRFFSVSVIAGLLNSIFSILFVFLLHNQCHVLSVVIGALSANILQLFINIYFLVKMLGWSFRFVPEILRRKTINDSIVAQLGNFASMLMGYVPLFLISKFPSGILSSIYYSGKIPDMISLLVTVQFGSVAGIKFNELYAQRKDGEIKKTFVEASAFLQFILIPICIIICLFSQDIIALFFGHGAFNKASVSYASQFMKYFILVLPFTAHNTLVARLFTAAQKINKSYIYQIIMAGVMVVMVYIFISIIGPSGYPVGVLSFYIFNSFTMIIVMRMFFKFVRYERTLLYTLKCLILNAPLAALVFGINAIYQTHSPFFIIIIVITYCIFLILFNHIFKVNLTIIEIMNTLFFRLKNIMVSTRRM